MILHVKASRRPELETLLRMLPAILSGKTYDHRGIARGFRMRMAFMFFSLVKEAFIVKSRGGTDECGISWPKLSAAYLAYQRPMGRNGKGSRKPPRAGKLAPGGNDGFMSKKELARWRATYSHKLSRLLLAGVAESSAKGSAAAAAWAEAKRLGVRTKLDVFGNREVEILRDRGLLFNSLSPGVLGEHGETAEYLPTEDQVVRSEGNSLAMGTAVEYAGYHQNGKRPLWPKSGELPEAWWREILEVGMSGLFVLFRTYGS